MVQFECHWQPNFCISHRLGGFHFLIFLGNKGIGTPKHESEKLENFQGQNWLKGLQMVQIECPRHPNTCVSLRLGEFHFLIFLGNKGIGTPKHESQKVEYFHGKIGLKHCK